MPDPIWTNVVRAAGAFQLLTVALAHFTPIPRDWDENLTRLPNVHRRFAIAQNVFIGGTMVFGGIVSLSLAPQLVSGSLLARAFCTGLAVWWGGRLLVLPWLRVGPELRTNILRLGFVFLHLECAALGLGYAYLALR